MKRVTLQIRDDVARIVMDDRKANVMSADMLGDLNSALTASAASARVTVLEGRPGIFSAGFDLETFKRGDAATREMMNGGVSLITAILQHPHPVVCLCTGHAYPMGAFLLLAADYRIGVSGDWRIGLNETAIGITVPHFALALARHRLHPSCVARIGSAAMFDPAEAVHMGYLDEVVAPSELEAAAASATARMMALHGDSYRATKHRLNGQLVAQISAAGGY
jgi:enoyl-CoA hydratase